MGAVYEGTQLRLNRRVAVKLMAQSLAASEEALARFRREAEVTSQIGHPHIVHVVDFGAGPSGEPYLVMEYLEGEDLEHRLRRVGRLSVGQTMRIVKQVASALAATHARGIIHRDLKPANIFLMESAGEEDFVKVVDFGISKVRVAATKLTDESAVMGTPSYMSPEQATGRVDEIDHRADEWALACITYEMLCGRPPFRGDDTSAVLYQAIHQDPAPLAGRVPDVSVELDKVLGRGLAKQQTDRFPTVSAFMRALEAVAAERPVPSDSSGPAPIRRLEPPPEPMELEPAPQMTTTFSQTAGEITNPLSRLKARLTRPWLIAALGGVVVVLLVVALATLRTGPSRRTSGSGTSVLSPQASEATVTRSTVKPLGDPSPPPKSGPDLATSAANVVSVSPRREVARVVPSKVEPLAPVPVPREDAAATLPRRPVTTRAAKPGPSTKPKVHLIQDL